jgi:hypothetical protein
MEVQSPSPPRGAFFRVGSWSIGGDTGSGRRSFDLLYGGSDADLIEEGRPEFDIEVTFVGFAVGGDRIRFAKPNRPLRGATAVRRYLSEGMVRESWFGI